MDAKLAMREKPDSEATARTIRDEPLFGRKCGFQPARRSTLLDPSIDGHWQPASQSDRDGQIFGEQPLDLVRRLRNSAECIDQDDCAVAILQQPLQKDEHLRHPPRKCALSIPLD